MTAATASKPDVCDCACHREPSMIHVVQCCEPCLKCGRDIRLARYWKHRESCQGLTSEAIRRNIRQDMRSLGVTGGTLRAQLRELTGRDPDPACGCAGMGLFLIIAGFDHMKGAFVVRRACLDCYPEMRRDD